MFGTRHDDSNDEPREMLGLTLPDLSAWADDLAACLRVFMPLGMFGRAPEDSQDPDFSRAVRAAPLAALWIGALIALALAFGWLVGLTGLVSSAFAVAVGIVLTGALHERHLSATADALDPGNTSAGRSGMATDSIAAYGVLTLVISLLLRVGAIAGIIGRGGLVAAVLIVISAETVSRAAAVWPAWRLPPARAGGGAFGGARPHDPAVHRCFILAALIAFVLMATTAGVLATTFALATASLAVLGMSSLARLRFGGQTDEIAGATQQVALVAFLLAALAALPV